MYVPKQKVLYNLFNSLTYGFFIIFDDFHRLKLRETDLLELCWRNENEKRNKN